MAIVLNQPANPTASNPRCNPPHPLCAVAHPSFVVNHDSSYPESHQPSTTEPLSAIVQSGPPVVSSLPPQMTEPKNGRRQEFLQLHRLLTELKFDLLDKDILEEESQLDEYTQVDTGPFDFTESVPDHKDAVFALCHELADTLVQQGETADTGPLTGPEGLTPDNEPSAPRETVLIAPNSGQGLVQTKIGTCRRSNGQLEPESRAAKAHMATGTVESLGRPESKTG